MRQVKTLSTTSSAAWRFWPPSTSCWLLRSSLGVFADATRVLQPARESLTMPSPPPPPAQPNNPLHGKTLEAILTALVNHYGWDGLAQRVALRCFSSDPSIGSSLDVYKRQHLHLGQV